MADLSLLIAPPPPDLAVRRQHQVERVARHGLDDAHTAYAQDRHASQTQGHSTEKFRRKVKVNRIDSPAICSNPREGMRVALPSARGNLYRHNVFYEIERPNRNRSAGSHSYVGSKKSSGCGSSRSELPPLPRRPYSPLPTVSTCAPPSSKHVKPPSVSHPSSS